MDKDYVDKFIKESLYNHETPIDNDLLWAAIEQKKSKGTSKVFGILGALVFVVIAGFALNHFIGNDAQNNNKSDVIASTDSNNKKPISTSPVSNTGSDDINTSSTASGASQSTNNATSYLDGNISFTKTNTASLKNNTTSLFGTKNTIANNNNNNNNNNQNLNNNSKVFNQSNSGNEVNTFKINNSSNFKTNRSNFAEQKNKLSNNDDSESVKSIFENHLSPSSTGKSSTAYGESASTTSANSFASENKIESNLLSRQIKNLQLLENQSLFLDTEGMMLPSKVSTDCPTFGSKKRNLYLQVYTIFDFVNSNLSSSDDNINYRNERDRTQTFVPSVRAGIQAKYLFDNGLYIKGGFEYGIVRERYKDRIVDTLTTIEPDQLISFFETSPGDTTYIYGPAPVTTITASNWNVKNSYRTIDIPLLVGYQMTKGQWTYGLELGVIHNIKLTTKSFILDTDLRPRLAPEYYKTRIGQSLTGGISLGYALTPDIKVLGLLHFKQNLSTINSDVNTVDQKNLHIGLGAGLEYRF